MAQQGENVSQPDQSTDSETDRAENKTASEKGSGSAGVRKSDGSSAKKATFTVQMASPFILQASTAEPELSGMFPVGATATGTDGLASNADLPKQSVDVQSDISVSGQSSELQPQANLTGPFTVQDLKGPLAEQESDAGLAAKALQMARSAAGEVQEQLTSLDPALQSKSQGTDAALQSTANAASDAKGKSTFDPTSILQASLTGETQKDSASRPSDGNLNQSGVKAIQSKVSGAAFGVNLDAGDGSKTAKSDDVHNDRSSAHIAGAASVQTQNSQSDGAHVPTLEVKGSDAGALQPVILAAQAEARGTTEAHTTAGSIESTAHRGNESEGLTSEQLTGSELAGMSGISTARLIQTMGATEMRVGMHSSEFGDISVRTTVSQMQMQTQISVEHNELGNALSARIPNMQVKLGSEYGLHATIEVNQSGASFSSDGDRSQQQQQKATVRSVEAVDGPATLQSETISLRGSAVLSGDYRLDIRA